MPLTSPLQQFAKLGVKVFSDVGAVYDAGPRLDDQRFECGLRRGRVPERDGVHLRARPRLAGGPRHAERARAARCATARGDVPARRDATYLIRLRNASYAGSPWPFMYAANSVPTVSRFFR